MPYAEEFTLLSRTITGQDGDGNDVWSTTETTVRGCMAHAGSAELVQGQATVLTHDTIYLDEGEPVPGPHDQMRVRGVVRDIDGSPEDYQSPFTGWRPGPVVRLLEVMG